MTDVDAVSEDGVHFFTLKETFDSVTEFNGNASLCHINYHLAGSLGRLVSGLTGQNFIRKDSER